MKLFRNHKVWLGVWFSSLKNANWYNKYLIPAKGSLEHILFEFNIIIIYYIIVENKETWVMAFHFTCSCSFSAWRRVTCCLSACKKMFISDRADRNSISSHVISWRSLSSNVGLDVFLYLQVRRVKNHLKARQIKVYICYRKVLAENYYSH